MPRLPEKENTWRATFALLRVTTVLFLDCSVLAVWAEQEPLGFRIPYTSLTFGLGFDNITEGFLVFEGVPVRGVEALEFAPESCFVGDFVGD
jgi:hypothetical protein